MILLTTILASVTCVVSGELTSYPPVILWESTRSESHVIMTSFSPLKPLSAEKFQEVLEMKLKDKTHVAVFIEDMLALEDFSTLIDSVSLPFENLSNLTKMGFVTFFPMIEEPLNVISALPKEDELTDAITVTFNDTDSVISSTDAKYLFFNFDDPIEYENRPKILNYHDIFMMKVFTLLQTMDENVAAIYTSQQGGSASNNLLRNKREFSDDEFVECGKANTSCPIVLKNGVLFSGQDDDGKVMIFTELYPSVTLRFGNVVTFNEKSVISVEMDDSKAIMNISMINITISCVFHLNIYGYWNMSIYLHQEGKLPEYLKALELIEVPNHFSYHCGNKVIFQNDSLTVEFHRIQVQPFFGRNYKYAFGDPYDCIPFFSIPILSGLLVTSILGIILTLGLCMILDIKSMDRFDDPKGKTITILSNE